MRGDALNLAEEVQAIELVDLSTASGDVVASVREVRNEHEVRKNMYTDHEIAPDEHLRWVSSLKDSRSAKFYAVMKGGVVIGGVGVSAINVAHQRADWAYYLSSSAQGRGTGSALEFKFLDFVFGEFGIHKLNCEVIDWNASVVKLHKRFGFLEEGVRRDHVLRGGQFHDVVLLGITKEEWADARARLTERLFVGA